MTATFLEGINLSRYRCCLFSFQRPSLWTTRAMPRSRGCRDASVPARSMVMSSCRLRVESPPPNFIRPRCIYTIFRGVASGTASRALALLDFWLAGPIKPTFSARFPCTATRLLERSLSSGGFRGGFFAFNSTARVCVS